MKKRIVGLFIVFALSLVVFAACGGGSAVKLVDFEPTATESKKLGDIYELLRTVEDEDGNTYTLSYDVKTKAGTSANDKVVDFRFELTNVDGYTITYTAVISDKDTRTRVVTLTLTDNDPPAISIGAAPVGTTGQLYTLPSITFNDLSGVAEQTVDVHLVVGETLTKQELTTEGGIRTFTPTISGIYRISAYAKDNKGNDITRTADFQVLKGGVALTIDENTPNLFTANAAWAVEYDEDGGYISWTSTQNSGWQDMKLTDSSTISYIDAIKADYTHLLIRLYPVGASGVGNFSLFGVGSVDIFGTRLSYNEWSECYVPVAAIDFSKILFSVQFNQAGSGNTPNLTELRFAGFEFVNKDADLNALDGNGLNDDVFKQTGTIEFELITNALPPLLDESGLKLKIYNSGNQLVETLSYNDGVFAWICDDEAIGMYTAKVSAGYSYLDALSVTFQIVNESTNYIVLPAAPTGIKAGQPITITEALQEPDVISALTQVSVGNASIKSIVYKDAADNAEHTVATDAASYVPAVSGKLCITYEYANAVDMTLEISVDLGSIPAGYALPDNKDAVNLVVVQNAGNFNLAWNTTGGYLSWTRKDGGNIAAWQKLWFKDFEAANAAKAGYTHFKVSIWTDSSAAYNVWLSGSGVTGTGLTPNAWHDVYLPIDKFDAKTSGTNDGYIMSTPGAAEFANVKEIRLKGIQFVNLVEGSLTVSGGVGSDGDIFEITEGAAVFTFNGTLPTGLEISQLQLEIRDSKDTVVKTITGSGTGFVWEYTDIDADTYTATVIGIPAAYTLRAPITVDISVLSVRIVVDGTYQSVAAVGLPITILDSEVFEASISSGPANVVLTMYYTDGTNADVTAAISEGKYTPVADDDGGILKITYSFGDFEDTHRINISLPDTAFNPEALYARDQLKGNANTNFAFKEADEERDADYTGAYWELYKTTSGWGWANFYLNPTFASSEYAKYDYITMWIKLERSPANEPSTDTFNTSIFNSGDHVATLHYDTWEQIQISSERFSTLTFDQIFLTYNINNVWRFCLGEIVGGYDAP